ncbi:hypothetical protein BC939DRAFT_478283 [Gamsiella multidivaricata]|uniref:uncharacterized protein n=1 Tax=Gamsiella multidivaricata TaxID=101098 RepID=UPI0022212385|nr:uncharacterized protein BC939DRAFT_478283 [Gamsiella multidivaricata]KAI7821569.1 hypothetical protein BC939DRAFT_478283 [Gamsiella multidivaricata]
MSNETKTESTATSPTTTLPTKVSIADKGTHPSSASEAVSAKEPPTSNIPSNLSSTAAIQGDLAPVKRNGGNSKLLSSKASLATVPTTHAPTTKATSADLIDGTLSDFDGSDLSDLSSASSASGSDQESGQSGEEDMNAGDHSDESKHGDEDGDEPMGESSASDDSDLRSNPRLTKRSKSKNTPRSKHSRRIPSDSSEGEQELPVIKRKPGRPPKLKNQLARSRTTQSPMSPTTPTSLASPTFSNPPKKANHGSTEVANPEHPTKNESQPRKKTKQADFANVGKRDRSGRTQLFKYTAMGDLETCRKLIEAGAQVNDRDHAEWTPLHEACVTGHEKVAELLIQHNADVNARGGHMDTPLHDAAQNGHVEVVKLLLSYGANVLAKNAKGIIPIDVTDDKEVIDLLQRRQALVNMLTGRNQAGQTLLHRVCSSGTYNNVLELLNQGADINAQDNAQWTPLHEAALEGHTKVVELLLSRGANPNVKGHGSDTALHDSAQNEHADVVRLLLEYGADPDFKNSKGEKPCDVTDDDAILELLRTGARGTKKPIPRSAGSLTSSSSSLSSLTSQSSKFSTPSNQSSHFVGNKVKGKDRRNTDGGADVHMSDEGRSAGEERPAQMSRDERKMQQLLSTIRMQEQMEERKKAKKGRPKHVSEDEGDDDGRDSKPSRSTNNSSSSSMWKHSKASHSSSRSITKISKSGPKGRSSRSEERDDESDSEPNEAPRMSRRSVQRSTGDRFRIDPRYKDSAGRTQLHQWAASGDIEMVGTVLEGGAERDPRDHEGLTPLHVAAKAGNTDVLVLLLAYGCNVNAQDHDKATALHEAVRHHHTEAVRLLLQNNALVSLRDSKKRTCLELASHKDTEIRSLVKTAMEQVELKAKERSKKRLSQSIESHGSPKHKERKTSRHSDSDEPIKFKKKDSDKRDADDKNKHSRNGSSSGTLLKSISMPSIAVFQSSPTSSSAPASMTTAMSGSKSWKYSTETNDTDLKTPLKKQKLHSRRMSSSGANSSIQEGDEDVEMKSSGSSKKRRESDRHEDGYGGKVKIKKEREDDGHHFRSPSLSTKSEELRRVASLPSFSKDGSNNGNGSGNGNKSSRHASKLSLSSRPSSSLGMAVGSSIATISPPLTETSSSPPPISAQTPVAQDQEAQKSRKRSSQTFASPSGYQKFADDLKLGSSTSQHHRQRSTNLIPSARSTTTSVSTEPPSAAAEIDAARKKAKTSTAESNNEQVNGKPSAKEIASVNGDHPISSIVPKAEEGEKVSSVGTETAKKVGVVESLAPAQRSVQDAQRYLPLYTVQLSADSTSADLTSTDPFMALSESPTSAASQHFCVVDQQVQLLLGLAPGALFERYPHLHRRLINKREKARLWSPLSSMVSDRCAAAVKMNFEVLPVECQFSSWTNATNAMSRLKEHEKQKFLSCELYFIRLEEVIELIKQDYAQLNESMMTIMLDIGYDELEMEVEKDVPSVIKTEQTEERLKEVKEEEGAEGLIGRGGHSRRPMSEGSSVPGSTLSSSGVVGKACTGRESSDAPVSAPASLSATSAGYIHKMRRVPAKMATKAMFKGLQQQYRPSS